MWGYEMKWINIIVIVIGNIVEIMNVRIGFIFDIKLFGCVELMLKNYFLGYWNEWVVRNWMIINCFFYDNFGI